MTHAYQEIYLSNAQALLGDAFDYAINACGVAGDSFIKLFSVSSVSNRIENIGIHYDAKFLSVKYSLEIQVPIYLICAAEYFRCWASSSCLIIGNMPCMK